MSKYIHRETLLVYLNAAEIDIEVPKERIEWHLGYLQAIRDIKQALNIDENLCLTWHEVMVRGIEEELKG